MFEAFQQQFRLDEARRIQAQREAQNRRKNTLQRRDNKR